MKQLLLAVLCLNCGANSTTGKQVVLHTKLTSDLTSERSFVTDYGWNVTLTHASFSTGPLYYFDGEPAFTRRAPSIFEFLKPIQTAYAHPGHYVPGNAVGQMLQPQTFDLLETGPFAMNDGTGITGPVRSATFSFSAPDDGHAVVVGGTAERDGGTVYFTVTAALSDIERTAKDAQITGCKFDENTIDGDETVLVTVKPRIWFNLVDFTKVDAGTPESPTLVDPASVPHIAFALGLGQLSAYEFQLQQ
jgi:hypothetical protein